MGLRVWSRTLQDAYLVPMTSNEQARGLPAIIGERLRLFRDAQGLRQEDVAEAAREYGFGWGRSSVASLEAGTRDLSVAELLMLPSVMRKLGGWEEPLIPASEIVRINDAVVLPPYSLQSFFLAPFSPTALPESLRENDVMDEILLLGSIETPKRASGFQQSQNTARDVTVYNYIYFKLWPRGQAEERATSLLGGYEIYATMADRLTTPRGRPDVFLVSAFALGMWGRPAGEERDARVDERRFRNKRALQSARGHATRALIEEMQHEIDERWPEVQEAFDELERVIDSKEKLAEWKEKVSELEFQRYREAAAASPSKRRRKGLGR